MTFIIFNSLTVQPPYVVISIAAGLMGRSNFTNGLFNFKKALF